MKFTDFYFSTLGEIGRYQKIQFFLVCLPTVIVSMHALSWTFVALQTPYRCALPDETGDSPYYTDRMNVTECKNWEGVKVPITQSGDAGIQCTYADTCSINNVTCDMHVFDRTKVKYTAMDRWDIVCTRSFIKALVQSSYYVGQMFGSFIFGILGDKYGRKKVFFTAIVVQITSGLSLAISPEWWIYAIFRAGTGFSHPGIFVIAVVIGMELVGKQYRKLASVITGGFFALGQIILGVEAYFVRDYRYLQVVIATPAIIFLIYWWIVPESSVWLVSKRKYKEADEVLQKAAKMNNVTIPKNWWEDLDEEIERAKTEEAGGEHIEKKNLNIFDLFRTPELAKRTLMAFFLWPVCSMVYYGMSMKADILGGDMYINFIFAAVVEIPALVVVFLLIDRVGRRGILSCGFLLAGVCLFANYLMGDVATFAIALVQLMVTKGAITATYAALYTYSPELFPTQIRNTAMGCCSMIARIGAISGSFMAMWIAETYGKVFMIVPFAALAMAAGVLTLILLPETMGKNLPETIEEIEKSNRSQSSKKATEHELEPLSSTKDD